MTASERVALIRPGVEGRGGTWADLGAGSGTFTLALASLLGPEGVIHAVDRDARALRLLEQPAEDGAGPGTMAPAARPLGARIVCRAADFTRELDLPPLDGVLLANSLHFQPDPCAALRHAARWLKPGAVLIVVEYDVARPNPWVPHPLPWSDFPHAAECAGLVTPRLLANVPSAYHGRMYAAACRKPKAPSRPE